MTLERPAAVIVLAAGGGTRMKSATPKVLHTIAGRTLLGHVLDAVGQLHAQHLVVVVRHGRDDVATQVAAVAPDALVADQDGVAGTGRAVQCALDVLPPALTGTVLVTYGDVPLQTPQLLTELLDAHHEQGNAVTVVTAELAEPCGYGRIIRGSRGEIGAIVEEKDATEGQRRIREVNSGIFAYEASVLRSALGAVRTDNVQGEVYLTDVVGIARRAGHRVGGVLTSDPLQTEGVNTRGQQAQLRRQLNQRLLARWMAAGVEVVDPDTTWVDVTVQLAPDVCLLPGVQLLGSTEVQAGARIGPDTTLTDVTVGAGATVMRTHAVGAVVGEGVTVGPFAYLRPGTVLGAEAKVGAFVETKNARFGEAAKANHLSYVGDADIGAGTNIGAGTIFANYDGQTKHHTRVGARANTGANNTFVAPVEIGDGAVTGAGTVVRRNVPPGALAVSAGPQRHIDDWVRRKRPGTAAARAAAAAQGEPEEEADA